MSRNWNVLQAEFGDGFTMFACFYSCLLSYICVCVCARFFIPDSHYFWLLALKDLFFFSGCIRCFTKCEFCCTFPPVKKCHSHCRSKQWDNNWFQRIGDEISTLSKCSANSVWLLTKKKKRNKRKCWLALRFKITTNWSVNFAQNPFSSGFLPNSITIGDIFILNRSKCDPPAYFAFSISIKQYCTRNRIDNNLAIKKIWAKFWIQKKIRNPIVCVLLLIFRCVSSCDDFVASLFVCSLQFIFTVFVFQFVREHAFIIVMCFWHYYYWFHTGKIKK